jgi:3-oxoadipate enol-lactonase
MATLNINGVPMAYEEAGNGPALILLHAGIADRRMWRDVMPAFAERFRTIAPDLRAYGDTPLPDDPFCWTADVLRLMDELAVPRAHLVGVSMSSRIAIDLALEHPERVERMVLCGAGIPGWEYSQVMADNDDAERSALEAGDLDGASWLEVRVWLDGPDRRADQVDPELRRRVFEMQRRAYEIDNENAELSWLVSEPRQRYAEIKAPTLVLAGALDQVDVRRIAPVLAGEIPGAVYRELPGVAHLPPMEDPATFTSVVNEFLAGA